MASSELRFLVKAPPTATTGTLALGAAPSEVTLTRLLPDIERSTAAPLSARAAPVWHVATVGHEEINPWDACHALVQKAKASPAAAASASPSPTWNSSGSGPRRRAKPSV